jgi:hypothetical protein
MRTTNANTHKLYCAHAQQGHVSEQTKATRQVWGGPHLTLGKRHGGGGNMAKWGAPDVTQSLGQEDMGEGRGGGRGPQGEGRTEPPKGELDSKD